SLSRCLRYVRSCPKSSDKADMPGLRVRANFGLRERDRTGAKILTKITAPDLAALHGDRAPQRASRRVTAGVECLPKGAAPWPLRNGAASNADYPARSLAPGATS